MPTYRRRPTTALVASSLVVVLTLGACSDGGGADGGDTAPEPPATEPADGDTDATTDGADADDADDGDEDGGDTDGGGDDGASDDGDAAAPPLDAEASTDDREQEPSDAALTVTDVRVGTHDGFDRVTFEVQGDGELGWFTSTDDEAIAQGSGQTVEVDGAAVLTVNVAGVLLPFDRPDDHEPYETERLDAPDGAVVLTEVVDNNIYEGYHQFFVGLEEPVAYRLTRLEEPQRLVIDLVHP